MNYRRLLLILAALLLLPFALKVRADDSVIAPVADDTADWIIDFRWWHEPQFVPDSALLDTSDIAGWLTLPDSIKVDSGWLVYHGPDSVHFHKSPNTLVVYYIDTVGWREVSRDSTQKFEAWRTDVLLWYPGYDNPAERKTQWLITVKSRPILDTIFVTRFQTHHDTKQIKKWRVRIEK